MWLIQFSFCGIKTHKSGTHLESCCENHFRWDVPASTGINWDKNGAVMGWSSGDISSKANPSLHGAQSSAQIAWKFTWNPMKPKKRSVNPMKSLQKSMKYRWFNSVLLKPWPSQKNVTFPMNSMVDLSSSFFVCLPEGNSYFMSIVIIYCGYIIMISMMSMRSMIYTMATYCWFI